MPNTLLTLPPEVRITIFEYVFAGAMVRYEPRMYRPPYRRLTERYRKLLAPEAQILFVCKQALVEARPVLVGQATVNISNIFATKIPQRHAFMESIVYPAVKKLRITGSHPNQQVELPKILPQLPQLIDLELHVLGRFTWWIEFFDLPQLDRDGITSEALRYFSAYLKGGFVRVKDTITAWKDLDHTSRLTINCDVICSIPMHELPIGARPPVKRICQWSATADLVTGLVTLTPLDTVGTSHREIVVPIPGLE